MGSIRQFEKEKLVIAVLFTDREKLEKTLTALKALYGPVDLVSETYSFSDYSVFYDGEIGGTVYRVFYSFENCVDPSELAEIKRRTNELELLLSPDGGRRVNIDPGLISHGRYVMATTKNAGFRIPLNGGIYADLSLVYSRGKWNEFFWTYADIKGEYVKSFLCEVRELYLKQRREGFDN